MPQEGVCLSNAGGIIGRATTVSRRALRRHGDTEAVTRPADLPGPTPAGDRLQRACGDLHLGIVKAGLASRVHRLGQSGCLRACFPRAHGLALETVLVNTAGGIADGDRLRIGVAAGPGTGCGVSTQAAERIYGARPDAEPAVMDVTLGLASGARLDWLPQETIFFDRAALMRKTVVDMAPDAIFLGLEALIFGRAAHGETVRSLRLNDSFVVRRGGALVLHEAIRLHGDVASVLAQPASASGARGVAVLIYAAPDAGRLRDALRERLAAAPAECAASFWNGILVARLLAPDAAALRAGIVAALGVLRPGPLPRVWNA
jgi:urease accessory protein